MDEKRTWTCSEFRVSWLSSVELLQELTMSLSWLSRPGCHEKIREKREGRGQAATPLGLLPSYTSLAKSQHFISTPTVLHYRLQSLAVPQYVLSRSFRPPSQHLELPRSPFLTASGLQDSTLAIGRIP